MSRGSKTLRIRIARVGHCMNTFFKVPLVILWFYGVENHWPGAYTELFAFLVGTFQEYYSPLKTLTLLGLSGMSGLTWELQALLSVHSTSPLPQSVSRFVFASSPDTSWNLSHKVVSATHMPPCLLAEFWIMSTQGEGSSSQQRLILLKNMVIFKFTYTWSWTLRIQQKFKYSKVSGNRLLENHYHSSHAHLLQTWESRIWCKLQNNFWHAYTHSSSSWSSASSSSVSVHWFLAHIGPFLSEALRRALSNENNWRDDANHLLPS